ncbi:MAG: hypothetical protein JXA03_13030 [Bacteroidales bacterium]|nr:hypothetical protein [Bacteroidales bacterium]
MPKPIIWSPLSEKDVDSILDYLQKNWDIKVVQKQFPIVHKRLKVRKCVITKHNALFYREMKRKHERIENQKTECKQGGTQHSRGPSATSAKKTDEQTDTLVIKFK